MGVITIEQGFSHEGPWVCDKDEATFCKAKLKDSIHCLKRSIQRLSKGCKQYFISQKVVQNEKWDSMRESCRKDSTRLCDEHFDEHIPVVQCLLHRKKKLSANCSKTLDDLTPSDQVLGEIVINEAEEAAYQVLNKTPPSNITYTK